MILALIVLLSFVVYGRAIRGEFLFDDPAIWDMTAPRDPHAPYAEKKAGGGESGIFKLPNTGFYRGFHKHPRAVTNMTYAWTWRLFGFEPYGWHLFNLVAHAVNIGLAYILAGYLLDARGALTAAAVFGLHPHQAASVCYISGRAAILAAMFTMCAFILLFQGGVWCQFLAVLSAYLAAKSKQDAPVYWLLFPALYLWRL